MYLFTEGVKTVSHKSIIQAHMGTKYRCINSKHINMKNVNVTFSNVTLEAYLTNGTFSVNSKYLVTENVLDELTFPIIGYLSPDWSYLRWVQAGSEPLITASFEMNGLASGFLCRVSESMARRECPGFPWVLYWAVHDYGVKHMLQ